VSPIHTIIPTLYFELLKAENLEARTNTGTTTVKPTINNQDPPQEES